MSHDSHLTKALANNFNGGWAKAKPIGGTQTEISRTRDQVIWLKNVAGAVNVS